MKAWIMGIVVAILLTTLIDVILAEGETKKYVKGIASLIVLVAIIAPLPKLLNKDFEFSYEKVDNDSIPQSDSYLQRIYMERYKNYELSIQQKLKSNGIDGVVVEINLDYTTGEIKIINVLADITNAVITKEDKNIDINMIVENTIKSTLNVDFSKIIIVDNR